MMGRKDLEGSRRLSIRADPKVTPRLVRLAHRAPIIWASARRNRGLHLGTIPQGGMVLTSASFHSTQHHLVTVGLPSCEPFTSARSVVAADQPITPPQLSNHLRFKHCHKRRDSGTLGNCLAEPRRLPEEKQLRDKRPWTFSLTGGEHDQEIQVSPWHLPVSRPFVQPQGGKMAPMRLKSEGR
jgi:hypothetical protein